MVILRHDPRPISLTGPSIPSAYRVSCSRARLDSVATGGASTCPSVRGCRRCGHDGADPLAVSRRRSGCANAHSLPGSSEYRIRRGFRLRQDRPRRGGSLLQKVAISEDASAHATFVSVSFAREPASPRAVISLPISRWSYPRGYPRAPRSVLGAYSAFINSANDRWRPLPEASWRRATPIRRLLSRPSD